MFALTEPTTAVAVRWCFRRRTSMPVDITDSEGLAGVLSKGDGGTGRGEGRALETEVIEVRRVPGTLAPELTLAEVSEAVEPSIWFNRRRKSSTPVPSLVVWSKLFSRLMRGVPRIGVRSLSGRELRESVEPRKTVWGMTLSFPSSTSFPSVKMEWGATIFSRCWKLEMGVRWGQEWSRLIDPPQGSHSKLESVLSEGDQLAFIRTRQP